MELVMRTTQTTFIEWIDDKLIDNFLDRNGYEIHNTLYYLKNYFGFKNGSDVINCIGCGPSFLYMKFAVKQKQLNDFLSLLSTSVQFLKNQKENNKIATVYCIGQNPLWLITSEIGTVFNVYNSVAGKYRRENVIRNNIRLILKNNGLYEENINNLP